MSSFKKSLLCLFFTFLMILPGCSKPQSISDVSRILYARYHERLLNVRFTHDHQLLVIYKMNPLDVPSDSVQRFAHYLAGMAYTNFPDSSGIDSIIIRFQSTGAPTIINEKSAENFPFSKNRLK